MSEANQNKFRVLSGDQEDRDKEDTERKGGTNGHIPLLAEKKEKETGPTAISKEIEQVTRDIKMEQESNNIIVEEEVIEEVMGDMDLNKIAKVWEKRGIEAIPEEYLQKIEEAYLYQEELKQAIAKRQYEDLNKIDIKSNVPANQYKPNGVGRMRGRKSTIQIL